MKWKLFVCSLLGVAALMITACKEDEGESQREKDERLIQEYITANNLNAKPATEGLYYVVETEGTGENPTSASTVVAHYKGTLLDGSKFDSSYDRGKPSTFPLEGVIKGWRIGIPLFKEGGKGILLIPSHLAYGENSPSSAIPKNAVLIFNIELIDVK